MLFIWGVRLLEFVRESGFMDNWLRSEGFFYFTEGKIAWLVLRLGDCRFRRN